MGTVIMPERDGDGNPVQRMWVREEFHASSQERTGGRYQAKGFDFVIDHAIGTWKEFDISFPYPISIFSTEWINETNFSGDFVQVHMAPDTIVGAITADVAASDTVIGVSQTVIDNIRIGYQIKLDDLTNTDELGRVVEVDKDNGQITVETAATQAFAAATPTYVRQTIEFIPHICLQGIGRIELAKDVVGGSYIPKDTVIRIRYKNNEGTTSGKVFSFILEYKY